jgi:hypothetical protein
MGHVTCHAQRLVRRLEGGIAPLDVRALVDDLIEFDREYVLRLCDDVAIVLGGRSTSEELLAPDTSVLDRS